MIRTRFYKDNPDFPLEDQWNSNTDAKEVKEDTLCSPTNDDNVIIVSIVSIHLNIRQGHFKMYYCTVSSIPHHNIIEKTLQSSPFER